MKTDLLAGLLLAVAVVAADGSAVARDRAEPPAKDAPAAKPVPPVASEPQQTSATYGDWVERCVSPPAPAKRTCEAAQSVVVKGQQAPIAQIAFSIVDRQDMVTVLLPTNISFDKPPQIGPDETHLTTLTFRRCIPGGCLASAKLEAESMNAFKPADKPGRLVFTDASERTLALPISFRGLAQALSGLAKEK